MLYFCQISQAANACSRSISSPFLTMAPFSLPFFMKRVSSGVVQEIVQQMVRSEQIVRDVRAGIDIRVHP